MKSFSTLERTGNTKNGTAVRQQGKDRVDKILKTAQTILITDGFEKLSLRNIASKLGISNGNVTYYFPNKDVLLHAIIEGKLREYDRAFESKAANFPDDPKGRFNAYIEYLIEDCKSASIRGFYYQIWSIASHNKAVAEMRDEIYSHFIEMSQELMRPLNPSMDDRTLNNAALTLIALVEGLHVIYGLKRDFLMQFEGIEEEFRSKAYLIATTATSFDD